MSDFEQEFFSGRDLFLMKEAMSAGHYYESLDDWLNEVISDGGHIVAQHLAYDAERLHPQPKPEYTVDREYLVQLITDRQKRIDAVEQQLQSARQIITELAAFCEQPEIVAATDGAFDPDATIQAAKRFLSGGEG